MSVASAYRQAMAKSNSISLQPGFGETWVSSTCIVSVDEHVQLKALQTLAAVEIETRLWWGAGAHSQPATAEFPRAESAGHRAFGKIVDWSAYLSGSSTGSGEVHRGNAYCGCYVMTPATPS